MTTIKRGTIRSYDAGEHRAAVQIAGSLATYLAGIPVATGIFPDAVVTGRECTVLFHADDDPTDAVVVSVQGASPPTTLTGDYKFDGDLNVTGKLLGAGVNSAGNNLIDVGGGGTYSQRVGLHVGMGSSLSVGSGQVIGVGGYALARTSGDGLAIGLDFNTGMANIDLATAYGVRVGGFLQGSGNTVTTMELIRLQSPTNIFASLTNLYGLNVAAFNLGTNRRAIAAGQISGGTIARLIELATDWFIVKGSGEWTPTANETPVWITEGATPTSRQVKWKDGAAITTGDRVMVLV